MTTITKGAFKALLTSQGAPPKMLPRQQHPDQIARAYTRRIQSLMKRLHTETLEALKPTLEELTAGASRVATTDALSTRPDALTVKLDTLRARAAVLFGREKLAGIVEPFAEQTEKFQAEQLNRQLREAVSIDVVGSEPWIGKAVEEFTQENVALIRTIPSRYFDEIETLVRREAADGVRWEELVDGIEERYDVSRSRSKILARDQVGKFYGDLNRVRQTDLGITRFIWRTVRDNRVRPEHADIDGESFAWGSAPDGGPGEAVLCRCYAEPDLTSVVDEVA